MRVTYCHSVLHTVRPELAGREFLPGHRGCSLSKGTAGHHEPGCCVIHGEGGVEDVSLGDDQAVEQGVHSEQESEDITVTEELSWSWPSPDYLECFTVAALGSPVVPLV